jgi:MoaA/NifB/PqqE/SkfB family radical SAM enzyme
MIIDKLVIKSGIECTLKCEKCGEFNPHLIKMGRYFSITALELWRDVTKLIDAVEQITTLQIAGGEPFLHKDIYDLIALAVEEDKVLNVEIVTNGTIVPTVKNLERLRAFEKKITVLVSDYSGAGVNNQKLLHELMINKINHLFLKEMIWKDKSDTSLKSLSEDELIDIAQRCSTFRPSSFSLINGVVTSHCCTSGSLMFYLDTYDGSEEHYFSVRTKSINEVIFELDRLENMRLTPMCRYCVPSYEADDCVAGGQMK